MMPIFVVIITILDLRNNTKSFSYDNFFLKKILHLQKDALRKRKKFASLFTGTRSLFTVAIGHKT